MPAMTLSVCVHCTALRLTHHRVLTTHLQSFLKPVKLTQALVLQIQIAQYYSSQPLYKAG